MVDDRRKSFIVHWPGYSRHRRTAASQLNDRRLIRCDLLGLMVTIDILPDDVLLAVFDFNVVGYQDLDILEILFRIRDAKWKIQSWQSLVHVCRRWRGLVFGSPRRLNLQLCCIPRIYARKSLDVWPALPLLIWGTITGTSADYIFADLEHSDRIRQIKLHCRTTFQLEKLYKAMQVPFPELAILALSFRRFSNVPVLPDSFMGGSAPCLRYFSLNAIPFPALPDLLLSTTHLHDLFLYNIPHSGYISPKAMATCLSMLTSLVLFRLEFKSPQSCPNRETRSLPPLTRSVLPAVTKFWFKGVNEYLEDLVSRIDAPQLYRLSISLFNDIHFDTPELNQFISRTPILGAYNEAHLTFYSHEALVRLGSDRSMTQVRILCQVSDWQLSSLAQICNFSLRLLLTMENLYIYENLDSPSDWKDDIENTEWLDLLLPFTTEESLPMQGICSTYSACPSRAHSGKHNRSIARSAKCSLGGVPAI